MNNTEAISDEVNAVFKSGKRLYFYGFDELGDKVVMNSVNGSLIMRPAKQGEEPTFRLTNNVSDLKVVIDSFERNRSLGYMFIKIGGTEGGWAYHQTHISVDQDEIGFSEQFQIQDLEANQPVPTLPIFSQ